MLGAGGRALVGAGLLVVLFVGYQLYGTGIREAQAQDALLDQFEQRLAEATETPSTPTTPTTTPPNGAPSTTAPPPPGEPVPPPADTAPPLPAPPLGEPAGVITIPEIGVEKVFLQGVSLTYLKEGPGHFPGTPLPGQAGNAAIAGHRTTYGAPFHNLDQLAAGYAIEVTTVQGEFTYEVIDQFIVEPQQVEVLDDVGDARLTLAACHPKYSAAQRIIVQAVLVGEPAPAPPPTPTAPDGTEELAAPPEPPTASASFDDLGGPDVSAWPALWWGLGAAAVALAVWLVARTQLGHRARRAVIFTAGALPVLVVLFFFFENLARLLPASY